MAYTKQTWADLPSKTTPINATRLTHIEDGIYNAAATADNAASTAGSLASRVGIAEGKITNLEQQKVDKETGKGLSENDFTNTLKSKLDGIASGAEVNVQSDWGEDDSSSDAFILNKPTLGTASTKNSTSVVTQSTDLVESGAVKDIVGWGNVNLLDISSWRTDVSASTPLFDDVLLKPNTQYTVSSNVPSSEIAGGGLIYATNSTDSPSYNTNGVYEGRSVTVTTNNDGVVRIYYYNRGYITDWKIWEVQLEKGSTATTYEPYHESVEEYCASKQDVIDTVGWCSTVLDKGVLASANVNSSGLINNSQYSLAYFKVQAEKKYTMSNCNDFTDTNLVFAYFTDVPVLSAVSYNNSRTQIDRGTATSQTVTAPIDGYIAIRMDNAANNIRFEEGEVVTQSVEDKKCDNSVIGTVEDGTNPTKSYAVGEHMIRNGKFCTVTVAVTTSSTWTEGSNYTSGDVASALNGLIKSDTFSGTTDENTGALIISGSIKRKIVFINIIGRLGFPYFRGENVESGVVVVRPNDFTPAKGEIVNGTYYYID